MSIKKKIEGKIEKILDEMDRTRDGEMSLLKASYIIDGGAQIVEANKLAWEIWLALNEQEMAEEAQTL